MAIALEELEKEYKNLAKKYSLPEFSKIHQDFELQYLEHKTQLLRAIRRRMYNRIGFYLQLLDIILYPTGQTPISSYESNFFSSEEKQELAHFYKLLMIYSRKSLQLDIESSDKKDAEYISEFFERNNIIKKQMKEIIKQMEEVWKKQVEKEEGGYFG